MRILVGLGNPGPDYRDTRHNVGFLVVEELRRRHGGPKEERGDGWRGARVRMGAAAVYLGRPVTFMNRSGDVVSRLLEREESTPADLLVVCDDFELEFGAIRLRPRGSHGGHNGLRSIIASIGTQEFARLRVGVGPVEEGTDPSDFVLAPFRRPEREKLSEVLAAAADTAEAAVEDGIERAMGRFNRRQAPQSE
jgi:peptidyl-tRNA hydrolase, PTH1 family